MGERGMNGQMDEWQTDWKEPHVAQFPFTILNVGFPRGSDSKESTLNAAIWVRTLGQEDPLEKGMAFHSSILAWRIP